MLTELPLPDEGRLSGPLKLSERVKVVLVMSLVGLATLHMWEQFYGAEQHGW